MRKLWYMGLEPYQGRYTLQLQQWNEAVFQRRGINYEVVLGDTLTTDQAIVTGQVLDAHGRTYYSLTQMARLVHLMKTGQVSGDDAVFFEDMYTTGLDALGYIMDQVGPEHRPRIYVRCLAQTIDPDDFLHVWGMTDWMRHYESSTNAIVKKSGGAVLASNEEMVAHMRVAGWDVPIYNVSGLAFGKSEVLGRVNYDVRPFEQRTMRVGFAARFDQEKQPGFFMDLIDEWCNRFPTMGVEFAVFSGGPLRSNDAKYLERARRMQAEGRLAVHENLTKNQYYDLLNDTRVLFNCALQDWTSNTISEADALGANVLFPAYRSFPETLANDYTRMYVPWSREDVVNKLHYLLIDRHPRVGRLSDWTNGCIDRYVDIMTGQGEQWRRDSRDYRNHTNESKY